MEALSESARDLGLFLVKIEGWIIICRTTFDAYIEGEPYQSLQLYANPAIKKYLVRIWGRTIRSGDLGMMSDLKDICDKYFNNFFHV